MFDTEALFSELNDTSYISELLEELGYMEIGSGYSRTVYLSPCGEYVLKINGEGVDNEGRAGEQNWAEYDTYMNATPAAQRHLAECVNISDCGVYLIMRRLVSDGSIATERAVNVLSREGLTFTELECRIIGGIEIAFDYAEVAA